MSNAAIQEIRNCLLTPSDVRTEDHSENMLRKLDAQAVMMGKSNLGFLYDKWRTHAACLPVNKDRWSSQSAYGDGLQETADLAKLKIINWGMLWGARGRLDNLSKAAQSIDAAVGTMVTNLQGAWSSKAGEAAAEKISELKAAAGAYGTAVGALRDHLQGAREATRQAVEKLANFYEQSDVGGKPIMDRYGSLGGGEGQGAEVRGDYSKYIDEMGEILQVGTFIGGFNNKEKFDVTDLILGGATAGGLSVVGVRQTQTPESLHAPGRVYLTEGNNRWSDQICRELNDFCECYFLTIKNLRRRIKETVDAVDSAWTFFSNNRPLDVDPFGKLALGGAEQPPTDTGGHDGRRDGGGGHDTPPPMQPPPMQPPVMPPPPEPPPLPDPADLDGDGKPDTPTDLDGDGKPDTPVDANGDGVPDDPNSGAGTKDAPETVTITDGDRTIAVDSPDGQGKVKVSVDDGSGTPKSYELDFGAATGLSGGNGATDGAVLGPDGQPLAQDLSAQVPGGGIPVGEDGVQHVVAGPDGKAVIQDGPLTITAERPEGAPDTVIVTVDDGTGEPTKYTLDYQDATAAEPLVAGSGSAGGNAAVGGSGAGMPGGGSVGAGGPGDAGGSAGGQGTGGGVGAQTAGGAAVGGGPADSGASGFAGGTGDSGASAFSGGVASGEAVSAEHGAPLSGQAESQGTFAASDSGSQPWGATGSVFDMDSAGSAAEPSGDMSAAASGEAGLSSAQAGADGGDHAGGQAGSGMGGGMPMGGGMGGGGSSGSGDQERAGSQWRTTGSLFDDDFAEAELRISGAIDGSR
ncbi:hypothetical protein [Actinokineospora iranica]|uniref:hypothetical protein n=1 Tax=Actinokineospora iranica TaxID=1271860 RepID=UPI001113B1F2|nr:hypothetical protein [Actinokineospora iranica]